MSAPNPRVREEMRQILIAVSEVWGVSVEEIIERDRHKTVSEARCVVYWLARKTTRLSYPEIGRAVGNRDHTTILAGAVMIERRRKADAWLSANLNAILDVLNPAEQVTVQ